jgi:hypothetical protein
MPTINPANQQTLQTSKPVRVVVNGSYQTRLDLTTTPFLKDDIFPWKITCLKENNRETTASIIVVTFRIHQYLSARPPTNPVHATGSSCSPAVRQGK